MWSLHIPAFRPLPQTESPAPMTVGVNADGDEGHESAAVAAAVSPVFDARNLVVKREPPPAPLSVADARLGAEVHNATMLRRSGSVGSAFEFVDVSDGGHQQPLPPTAVYQSFGSAVAPSSRLWTTESMTAMADEYDMSMAPRMASCSGGSLSGSDGGGRPQTSGVGSEDRSSTSPTTRIQPLNVVDAATRSTSSSFFVGKSCKHTTYITVG